MQTFATNFIASGGLLILLQQSAIPISMVITRYMLKVKYQSWNYIGAGKFKSLEATFVTF